MEPAETPADAWIDAIIAFWRAAGPDRWFAKDADFDSDFRKRFQDHHFAAARREYDHALASAAGSLALMLLLDQFPRNAFRGTAHMYATDPLARMFARQALAAGHDKAMPPDLRVFFYLPFAHSEDQADQVLSLQLHRAVGPVPEKHAVGHHDIVHRFGRFPHRNTLLCRIPTPEEDAFLAAGGFAG